LQEVHRRHRDAEEKGNELANIFERRVRYYEKASDIRKDRDQKGVANNNLGRKGEGTRIGLVGADAGRKFNGRLTEDVRNIHLAAKKNT